MKHKYLLAALAFSAISQHALLAQTTVVIDKGSKFQTMDGFGGFGARDVPWNDGSPLWNQEYINKVVNDLGISICRTQVPTTFEYINDNNDPFNTNVNGFNIDKQVESCKGEHRPLNSQTPYMSAMFEAAKAKGETIKFVSSIWSPPYWMKYIKCNFGTDVFYNRLRTSEFRNGDGTLPAETDDMKNEFAEYCVAYVRRVKEMTKTATNPNGIDLYAISPQNEPAFGQPYSSCVYSPAELARVVKAVGERFKKEGIKTKIFWPEDIGDLGRFRQYIDAVLSDTSIAKYGDIGAVHAYNSNGTIAGSANKTLWSNMNKLVKKNGPKQFWQTETSGYYRVSEIKDANGNVTRQPKVRWGGGMNLATTMHVALKDGQCSAWIFWSIMNSGNLDDGYAFLYNDQPNNYYIASKHYYRWIRPEAVSVNATATDASVLATAFQHDANKTLTVVLINQDSVNTKSIKLDFPSGSLPPTSFTRFVSSGGLDDNLPAEKCVDKGTVNSTSTISLPPNSITTLYGTGSLPYTSPTANETADISDAQWFVYSLPNSNSILVDLVNKSGAVLPVQIFDIMGRNVLMYESSFTNNEGVFDVSKLTNGSYFIRVNNQTKQFIIVK